MKTIIPLFYMALSSLAILVGCSSYDKFKREADDFEIPSLVVEGDFQHTWAAVVSTLKRFEIEQQNVESGVIKTKWIDNTLTLNFTDSFAATDRIKAARFRLMVSVSSVNANKKHPQTKVTIYKRQLVENDVFQGWREVENDYITEKTLLYRIDRVVKMDSIVEKLQRQKETQEIESFKSENSSTDQLTPDVQSIIPKVDPTAPTPNTVPSGPSDSSTVNDEDFPEI